MKRVRVISVIGLLLLVSMLVSTQKVEANMVHFKFGMKLGLFLPNDSGARDTFGMIPSIRIEYSCLSQGKSYGILAGLEYFFKSSAISPSRNATWKMIPATITFLYFPNPEKKSYFGIGLGVYTARIVEKTWGINRSITSLALGQHIIAGYNFKDNLFIEGKISSVDISHRDWEKNIGGISFGIGYQLY